MKMKRVLLIVIFLFILILPQAFATANQYPNTNRQTMWNNLTDSIHTLGQSPQQAQITKARLHYKRRIARQNSINQAIRKANH